MSFEEWREVRLGEVCSKVGSGATPTGGANAYCDKGISLIRSQNILDFKFSINGLAYINETQAKKLDNVIIEEGDVLLNITGDSVARNCIVPTEVLPARVNQHVAIIRGNYNQIDNRYILYCLQHNKTYLLSISGTGGTRNALTKKMLENFNILLPSLPEQKAIADTLTCLDDKIELNNRINKILEEMAQAIFKSWFVDFEPFQDGEFEDSELGRIPKGWRVGSLDGIADITMGQSPPGSSYNENADGEVFYQGRTDFGWRYPTVRLYTTEPKRVADKEDVLLSVRAPVGDVNVASEKCCIGRGLAALRSKNQCQSFLLYQILNLKESFRVYNGEGTVFGSINKETLKNMRVLIPPEKSIQEFQKLVGKTDACIVNNSNQIEVFVAIRDTLLPKLMSGEIRVPIQEVQ